MVMEIARGSEWRSSMSQREDEGHSVLFTDHCWLALRHNKVRFLASILWCLVHFRRQHTAERRSNAALSDVRQKGDGSRLQARLQVDRACDDPRNAQNAKVTPCASNPYGLGCPLRGDIRKNWNDTEKISMAPAQG